MRMALLALAALGPLLAPAAARAENVKSLVDQSQAPAIPPATDDGALSLGTVGTLSTLTQSSSVRSVHAPRSTRHTNHLHCFSQRPQLRIPYLLYMWPYCAHRAKDRPLVELPANVLQRVQNHLPHFGAPVLALLPPSHPPAQEKASHEVRLRERSFRPQVR